ncbi:MAG: manganese efflux pump [Actinomycetota bacterium]
MLALTLAALAVGFGNFAASISIGLSGVSTAMRWRVGIVFGLFEAGMPLVGLLLGHSAVKALGGFAGAIGGALLILIGAWQLVQALRAGGGSSPPPTSTRRLLITGFALSLDNLVVGFSLGVQHTPIVQAIIVFAVASVCLSLAGLEIGRRLGQAVEFGADYIAGFVLVAVGLLVAVGEI